MSQPAPVYPPQQLTDIEGTWNGVAGQLSSSQSFQSSSGLGSNPTAATIEFWAHLSPGDVAEIRVPVSTIVQLSTTGYTLYYGTEPPLVVNVNPPVQWGTEGWTHFALVLSNVNGQLLVQYYINEQLVISETTSHPMGAPGILGITLNGTGKYSEFRVWSTARTPAELFGGRARRYDDGTVPPGLVTYYTLAGNSTDGPAIYNLVNNGLTLWSGSWSSTTTYDLVDVFRGWLDGATAPLIDYLISQRNNQTAAQAASALKGMGVGATTAADALSATYGIRWDSDALHGALTSAGYTSSQIAQAVTLITSQSTDVATADIILRAAQDPSFLAQLQADPAGVLAMGGITVDPGTTLHVHVNAIDTMHVSVEIEPIDPAYALFELPQQPTPYQISLWIVTNVQAGGSLAQQLLSDPTTVLRQMGVNIPAGSQFYTWQNTSTDRHMVVPYLWDGETVPESHMRLQRSTLVLDSSTTNVNVNVNVNVQVDGLAVVNLGVVANVEAATQVSSALVAAEVVAVIVI